jgi:hypothetical protein
LERSSALNEKAAIILEEGESVIKGMMMSIKSLLNSQEGERIGISSQGSRGGE